MIPVAQAIPIVQQIRSGRRSAKIIIGVPGFLGVEVEECTETSAEQGSCQAPAINGAQITDLVEGGAAEQAGLPQSFVITGIDQAQVTDPNDLTTVLEQTSPGQAVQVTWNDGQGGSTQTTTVTLGAGPPGVRAPSEPPGPFRGGAAAVHRRFIVGPETEGHDGSFLAG